MIRSAVCLAFAFVLSTSLSVAQNDPYLHFPAGDRAVRQAILDQLLARLPADVKNDAFNKYLQQSGELPPDFDLLPSQFFLPDPLTWTIGGKQVRVTREQWPERRHVALPSRGAAASSNRPGLAAAEVIGDEAGVGFLAFCRPEPALVDVAAVDTNANAAGGLVEEIRRDAVPGSGPGATLFRVISW